MTPNPHMLSRNPVSESAAVTRSGAAARLARPIAASRCSRDSAIRHIVIVTSASWRWMLAAATGSGAGVGKREGELGERLLVEHGRPDRRGHERPASERPRRAGRELVPDGPREVCRRLDVSGRFELRGRTGAAPAGRLVCLVGRELGRAEEERGGAGVVSELGRDSRARLERLGGALARARRGARHVVGCSIGLVLSAASRACTSRRSPREQASYAADASSGCAKERPSPSRTRMPASTAERIPAPRPPPGGAGRSTVGARRRRSSRLPVRRARARRCAS